MKHSRKLTRAVKTLDAIDVCTVCGGPLPGGPLEGVCPACLLDTSLNALSESDHPADRLCGPIPRPETLPWQFGRYRITEEISRGGAGVVFRARDEALHRDVAIKFLHAGPLASRESVRRLFLEASAAARLQHPNIAPVYEVGGGGEGQPFLVMPFLEGGTLADHLRNRSESPQSPKQIATLIRKIALAVHHAHQHGILHRDLKPGNILFDAAGQPFVADFGLARVIEEDSSLTGSESILGTPAYMSPEQAGGSPGDLTTASDVHALGAILYELLAGHPPFSAPTIPALLKQIAETEPAPPLAKKPPSSRVPRHSSFERDLETICLKCLEKDPSQRYATALDLADELGRLLNDEPIHARPVGPAARLWRWTRRRPAVAGLSAALVLALMAGFAGTLWELNEARKNAAENVRQIARLNVLTGVNLMQDGDHFRSLLWFAEALRLNADPPEQTAVARQRIASIVARGPKLAAVITHDGQPVGDAAFHPVKDQLATVGRDRRLRVWDIPSGEAIFQTEPFSELPSDVFYSPHGERILVTSSEFNHAQILSATSGETLAGPISHLSGGANNRPLSPRFDSTGERLLTQSAPKTLRVWNTDDASPLGPPIGIGAAIAWMDFSEDGETILAITQDGDTTAWDWRTGVRQSQGRARQFVRAEDWPNGNGVQRTGAPESNSRRSRREETQTSNLENKSLLTSAPTVFSPDGTMYATISSDHRVCVWNADTGQPLTPPLDHNPASGPVEFSATGRYLFKMHPSHAVFVWDLEQSGEPPVLLRPAAPRALAESGQDGSVFVSRDPNSPIRVRTLSGASEVSLHPSSLKSVPVQAWFDETGDYIVLEYPRQQAQIWDAATGLPVTPSFPSRYATNEAGYLKVKLPMISLAPIGGEGRGEGGRSDSDLRSPSSALRPLPELLSGSRLDGTGGWKPLELDEIVTRWKELNGKHGRTNIVP